MAKVKKSAQRAARRHRTAVREAAGATAHQATARDAITLLKEDHRQVLEWFEQFDSTGSGSRKQWFARQICQALNVHTRIEEEIFYPAFLDATGEHDMHHEAEVEHESAKRLIEEIEASSPEDDYYDARVKVLSGMIRHHVSEEERRDGLFARARQSDMDLAALGERLVRRKAQLMGEEEIADTSWARAMPPFMSSGMPARLLRRI